MLAFGVVAAVGEGDFGAGGVVVGAVEGEGHSAACGDIGAQSEGEGVLRPVGGVVEVARRALGDGHHGLRRVAVAAGPAVEGAGRLGRVGEREGRCRNVVGGGIGRGHAAAVEVVGDVIGVERPVGGVVEVTCRALGNGHRGLRRGAVAAGPAREGVACLGRVIQGESWCCNVVGGRVGRGHAAAVEVVGDVVGDEGGGGGHCGIVVGGHGEGVAAEGSAVEGVGQRVAGGQVIVAQGDLGVAGVVGGALVGDALARGGDVGILNGERMHAARAGHVAGGTTVAYAHVSGVGRVVHGAVAVVVGSEGAVVVTEEGTPVGVAASDGRADDEAVLHRSTGFVAHESADVAITRDAGVGEDDVLDGRA